MSVKEEIDIEDLLTWAYRDQCIDREMTKVFTPAGPSASPSNGITTFLVLGTRIDAGSYAEKILGVKIIEDALSVHDAVLSMPDMFVEWIDCNSAELWTIESAAQAGHNIVSDRYYADIFRKEGGKYPLMKITVAVEMILHAKNATRPEVYPEWKPSAHRPPADSEEQDRRGRKRKKYEGPSAEEVMRARAIYLAWHSSLCALTEKIADRLNDYVPFSPAANATPWTKQRGNVLVSC